MVVWTIDDASSWFIDPLNELALGGQPGNRIRSSRKGVDHD